MFAGESFAVILGGNIAGVLKLRSISWRDSEFGVAIAFLALAVCAFLLPEPPSRQYRVVCAWSHLTIIKAIIIIITFYTSRGCK